MEYIYGAMLLHSVGKKLNEENLKKVLTAAGIKVDDARVKALIASLEGVNIEEAIKTAVAPVVAAPTVAPGAPVAEGKTAEKKEEKKKEKPKVSEEEAAA